MHLVSESIERRAGAFRRPHEDERSRNETEDADCNEYNQLSRVLRKQKGQRNWLRSPCADLVLSESIDGKSMAIQQRTLDNAEHIVNQIEKLSFEQEKQRLKLHLISAIKNLKRLLLQSKGGWFHLPQKDGLYRVPETWARDGWLPLDRQGKEYLLVLGIDDVECRVAVNAAHRAGLIQIKTYQGVSYIALNVKEAR